MSSQYIFGEFSIGLDKPLNSFATAGMKVVIKTRPLHFLHFVIKGTTLNLEQNFGKLSLSLAALIKITKLPTYYKSCPICYLNLLIVALPSNTYDILIITKLAHT